MIFVVISTGLIYSQLEFLRNKHLGFDKEHILILSLPEQGETQQWAVLKDALMQRPDIASAGSANFTVGAGNMRRGPVSAEGSDGQEQKFAFKIQINYLLFGLVFLSTLLLTFLVTGLQAVRIAQFNPAKTLKHE